MMKHHWVVLPAVLLIVSNIGADAQGNRIDLAVGGGQHDSGTANQSFSASLTLVPDGNNFLHGYVSLNSTLLGNVDGSVICVDVDANRAFIRWRQHRDDNTAIPEGAHILTEVIDNGPPVGGVAQDLIGNSLPGFILPGTPLDPCGTSVLSPTLLERGNITVHDGGVSP